ncbi:MAG: sigma factor [Syntrophomonadaceae bacterium]|nr:sigma factor [Syntrophomonadaceae bacterium]
MYSACNTVEYDNLINQAWRDYQNGANSALDDIYVVLMPFCLRVSSKTCNRYISEQDEEAGIARMAFLEALEKYDIEQGRFLLFLGNVIRNRIIDYKRKEKKRNLLTFSFLTREGSDMAEAVDNSFFEGIMDDLARKQEIEKLNKLLLEFNIGFKDLAGVSPRQAKTRVNAQKIAMLIAENEELKSYLMEKKMLPMKELEARWQVNRKIADRYRKFIIATTLIYLYEFPYLKSYVLPMTRGDENVC